MSETDRLKLRCPDCDAELVVDPATGTVVFHKAAKKPPAGGKDFDSLLAGLDRQKAEAEDTFEKERAALRDKDRLMEAKFEEALKRAQEDPDEKPPARPFDFE